MVTTVVTIPVEVEVTYSVVQDVLTLVEELLVLDELLLLDELLDLEWLLEELELLDLDEVLVVSVVHELMVGVVLLSVVWLQELVVGVVLDPVLLDLVSEDWVLVVFDSDLEVDAPQALLLDGVGTEL